MQLSFLGGAGTVTGSKHLVSTTGRKILIDCGMFQGLKEHRLLNWKPLSVEASSIHAVVLTHAHLDHTGYLPILVKNGFRGPIYCSEPTAELAKIVLLDTAKIQEEDAENANRQGYSKHKPALALYRIPDAEATFAQLKPIAPDQWHTIAPDIEIRLSNSGHILGSTFVELRAESKTIVFSGDLGREHPITLNPRNTITSADALVVESTYGDRRHPDESPVKPLARLINDTISRGGHVLIPTFAIGRTQDILHLIASMKADKRIPDVPTYLDSPMADRTTAVFDRYPSWHRLSSPTLKQLGETFHFVGDANASKVICQSTQPSIVLAGSGMLTGGRIKHHLVARLGDERNTVILVGYQAAGTLGRFLKERADEVKIFGQYVPVKAQITEIAALSAHADQHEILNWIDAFKTKPKKIFVVHGEPNASEGLRVRVTDQFHIPVHIARLDETVSV